MENISNFNSEKNFSSRYLVEQINLFRKSEGNNTEVRHSDLLKKIEKRFESKIAERKFSLSFYLATNGKQEKMYELPFEYCLRILMDESETVQDRCVEIMKAQQKEIERLQFPNFLDPAESAIAWATEYKAKQLAESKVIEMQPKVSAFDRVIDSSTTYTLDTVSDILNYGRTKLSEKLKEIGWAMKDSSKGTSSTRKSEESGYARTFFETVNRGEKEFKVKKIVVTKKGLDYLVNNFNELCLS